MRREVGVVLRNKKATSERNDCRRRAHMDVPAIAVTERRIKNEWATVERKDSSASPFHDTDCRESAGAKPAGDATLRYRPRKRPRRPV